MDNSSVDSLWTAALNILKENVRPDSYRRWFEPINRFNRQGDCVYITVADRFAQEYMEENYRQKIEDCLFTVKGEQFSVVFITDEGGLPTPEETISNNAINDPLARFNPRYTFESFVVGNSNRFAHAAAMAVSERPARTYNPLFIYGDSGLGKTHLMHAIAQKLLKKDHNANVAYVSTESFVNEFIYSIRTQQAHAFKVRYRNADIFLIDDIQFLSNKKETQEEFFHTFNTLHEYGKQIVISCDRPPKEIEALDERLRSRFEWGLITDIQPPDFETRCAILQHKAASDNAEIPDDVIFFIADKISSNIRELEGVLNKIIYYSILNKIEKITLADTEIALKDILPKNKKPPLNIEHIQKTVCEFFNISLSEMIGQKRDRDISYPRQIAMFLCRELLDVSFPKIGNDFGGRDHSTAMHAYKKINDTKKTDHQLINDLKLLNENISEKFYINL